MAGAAEAPPKIPDADSSHQTQDDGPSENHGSSFPSNPIHPSHDETLEKGDFSETLEVTADFNSYFVDTSKALAESPKTHPSSPSSPVHARDEIPGECFDSSLVYASSEACVGFNSPTSFWPRRRLFPWRPASSEAGPPFVSDESKPPLVGAGLTNLGNTCFLNAVLQCFTHTVPFVEGLRSCAHNLPCGRDSDDFCVICALHHHVDLSLANPGKAVSPLRLVENLKYFSSFFQRYQQEDAHEFLQCMLDKVDTSLLDSRSTLNGTLVKQIFGGRLISKLRCCSCNHSSDSYESIVDLSLEIKDVDNLPHALESFTMVEKIGGSDTKFTCEGCKEEVLAEKQFMLDQAPSIATFHLKRFKSDGSYVEKIDKHVAYPLEFDLQPYLSGNQDTSVQLKYELYAVVVHVGLTATSGHYFSCVRSCPDKWYKLDDSKVTRVGEDYVLSQEAYILFYASQGTPWSSSLFETQKICMDSNVLSTSPNSVLDSDGISALPTASKTHSPIFDEVRDPTKESSPISFRPVHGEADASLQNEISESAKRSSNQPFVGKDIGNQKAHEYKCNPKMQSHTPPRSPSPDLYADESKDVFLIPRNKENQVYRKRLLNEACDDSKKVEAARYMKKCMPSSRGKMLMAAMMGSQSESSVGKKSKRRMTLTPDVTAHSYSHRGSCTSPVRRRVFAE